jgi:hypothetical protein
MMLLKSSGSATTLKWNKNASDKIPVSSNEQKVFIGEGEGEGEEAMKAARARG